MTNKEKFLALVSREKTDTLARNTERVKNREMLRESQQIALKVLMRLDDLGWSQRDLAQHMKVSPQQITKIVSGKENLTIETQIKLQNILDIPVLASYYEQRAAEMNQLMLTLEMKLEKIGTQATLISNNYQSIKTIRLDKYDYSQASHQALAVS